MSVRSRAIRKALRAIWWRKLMAGFGLSLLGAAIGTGLLGLYAVFILYAVSMGARLAVCGTIGTIAMIMTGVIGRACAHDLVFHDAALGLQFPVTFRVLFWHGVRRLRGFFIGFFVVFPTAVVLVSIAGRHRSVDDLFFALTVPAVWASMLFVGLAEEITPRPRMSWWFFARRIFVYIASNMRPWASGCVILVITVAFVMRSWDLYYWMAGWPAVGGIVCAVFFPVAGVLWAWSASLWWLQLLLLTGACVCIVRGCLAVRRNLKAEPATIAELWFKAADEAEHAWKESEITEEHRPGEPGREVLQWYPAGTPESLIAAHLRAKPQPFWIRHFLLIAAVSAWAVILIAEPSATSAFTTYLLVSMVALISALMTSSQEEAFALASQFRGRWTHLLADLIRTRPGYYVTCDVVVSGLLVYLGGLPLWMVAVFMATLMAARIACPVLQWMSAAASAGVKWPQVVMVIGLFASLFVALITAIVLIERVDVRNPYAVGTLPIIAAIWVTLGISTIAGLIATRRWSSQVVRSGNPPESLYDD